jgi:hypothetical protein
VDPVDMDSDPQHCFLFSEKLDPDQYVMKTDPQPWLNVFPESVLNYGRESIIFPCGHPTTGVPIRRILPLPSKRSKSGGGVLNLHELTLPFSLLTTMKFLVYF